MDYQKLKELMSIQKKGDAAKNKRKAYTEEMTKLLKEESISENTQIYLKEGFSFEGSKCLALYFKSLSAVARKEELDKLLKSNLYYKNERGIAFKINISLLAGAFKMFPDDIEVIKMLMMDLPNKALKKEGGISKEVQTTIEKYFLCEIFNDTKLPNLAIPELQDRRLIGFKKLMMGAITSNNMSANVKPSVIDKIRDWISEDFANAALLQNDNNEGNIGKDSKAIINPNLMSVNDALHMKRKIEEMLESLILTLKQFNAINIELMQKNDYIRRLEDEKNKVSSENEVLKKHIGDDDKTIFALKGDVNNKNSEIVKLQMEISDLRSEIKKLNSVMTVYSADKSSAQSEQLNAIASKLKADYRDFKDAENMEMTVDLGENLRVQMASIFKILEKAGIIIERR